MDILAAVRVTVDKHRLLESGDAVLVGLSGGPDSVALLHLLMRLRRSLKLKLHAVYFNHGLRPRAAALEEGFCRKLCVRWKVPLTIVREDVPNLARRRRVGFEEAARDFRYEELDKLAKNLKCNRIALGHQADDQAETILFRILRGTGRTGLLGVPVKRGKIIRPLLDTRREEILAYLASRRITYCRDKSNADTAYRRNFIRHRLLPLLKKQFNPQVENALRELADTMGEEEQFLDQMTRRVYRRIRTVSPGGKLMLDLQIYARYPVWLRRRILRRAVAELTAGRMSLDKRTTERIDLTALADGKAVSLSSDIRVTATAGRLMLYSTSRRGSQIPLELDNKWHPVACPRGEIRAGVGPRKKRTVKVRRRSGVVVLDRQKVSAPLLVRPLKAGDRFTPLGMRGRKKVGNYLTDRKLPSVLRDEVGVVCDAHGIIWLVGWEIADRVKIDETTSEVVTIEFRTAKTRADQAV